MALDPTPIRWCVCGNTLFAELKEAGVTSLQEAQERFGVAIHCESCIPYIERMLRTGETAFPVRLRALGVEALGREGIKEDDALKP